MRRTTHPIATLLAMAAISGGILHAKDKHSKVKPAQPQDQIEVESQIPNADGPIIRFVATRHYDRSYTMPNANQGSR